ncbi:MAG: TerB family tellurite resistance protein, partial [bacterium]|nr:TerB family tellurite resistance protein [bacterium]
MTDRNFIIDLGKLLIAAAWADGKLSKQEINALRDLIFSLPGLTEKEWYSLELYLDSRVGPDEAADIMSGVLQRAKTKKDKEIIINTVKKMIESDNIVTPEENLLLENIKTALDSKKTGIVSMFSSLMGNAVKNRREGYKNQVTREERIDDFIKNNIYFSLVSEMETQDVYLGIPDKEIRTLCLSAGLMARIAWVDEYISDEEKETIKEVLQANWDLDEEVAELVSNIACSKIAKGLDYARLSRSFYEATSRIERLDF